jgi:hypothetical protein
MDSRGEKKCALNGATSSALKIRELNDRFRGDRMGGYVCLTRGVAAFGYATYVEILEAVAAFDQFTPENDPCGEHDFGALTIGGDRLIWKIDYYDQSETRASPDPTDPDVTNRILTIMLASEY